MSNITSKTLTVTQSCLTIMTLEFSLIPAQSDNNPAYSGDWLTSSAPR